MEGERCQTVLGIRIEGTRCETGQGKWGLTNLYLCDVLVGLTDGREATVRVDQGVGENTEVSVTGEVLETIKEGDHLLEEGSLLISTSAGTELKIND